jgi:valyl-tRNA synthetase
VREAARSTLVTVLDHALRLLHPVVPFVTAELWSRLPWPEGKDRPADLIVAPWPDALDDLRDEDAERGFEAFRSLVVEVRRLRKEYGVGEGQRVAVHVTGGPDGFAAAIAGETAVLDQLARVDRVETDAGSGVGANAVLPNGAELFLPLEGVIDVERERERMGAEAEKLDGLLEGARTRLGNEKFVANAPEDVVQKERDKVAQLEEQVGKLREKLAGLEG